MNRFQSEHRAGSLRNQLSVQLLTGSTAAGSRGQSLKTWTTVDTIWAGIHTLRGDEAVLARQSFAAASHRIVCRHNVNVKPSARLVLGSTSGRIFNIEDVDDIQNRDRWQDSICTEVVSP